MIEIVKLEGLDPGDIILIDRDGAIEPVTVKEITEDNLIIPVEYGGLDYAPEDPGNIVKIGEDKVRLILKSKSLDLQIGGHWDKILSKFYRPKWKSLLEGDRPDPDQRVLILMEYDVPTIAKYVFDNPDTTYWETDEKQYLSLNSYPLWMEIPEKEE